MVTTGPGIARMNLASYSRLRAEREEFISFAADPDYIVDDADIAAGAVGDVLALATAANGKLLPVPDFVTLAVTDASGTNLSLSVKIEGYRRGVKQSEILTATGAPAVGTSTKVYDQITSVTVTAIANAAASDLANVGFAGTRLGLWHGIEKVADVKRIIKRASAGTPSLVVVDADSVDLANEAIKITGAAGDIYVIEYIATVKNDGFSPKGALS